MSQSKRIASKKAFNRNITEININSLALFELTKEFFITKGIAPNDEINAYFSIERYENKIEELTKKVKMTYFK